MKAFIAIFILLVSVAARTQQLVLPGDYPDPSVVKIGDSYYASATTSNWAPAFPVLQSKDLVSWKTIGHVFLKLPDWADYYFWAPEISYDNGKVYMYYAAHKKGGNLCLGVASADKPEGPYTDHGPLMCQEVGSIDAFPIRDEKGKLHLIWKEDGNSVNKPTPIWIMEMNEERTKLIGEKKELFRNDAKWEGNLVEGVSIVREGEYYYAFYAAAACCGAACTYGVGIARSKQLMGPWEKYDKNPVLTNSDEWICPGHGTPVKKDGRNYFLYHAYDKKDNIFTGRQGLLIEYRFTQDGWIEFIREPVTAGTPITVPDVRDGFKGASLSGQWQWSVFQQPEFRIVNKELHLQALPAASGAFLGHKTVKANYFATAKLNLRRSTAAAGVAVIGDENNMVSALYENGVIRITQLKEGKETELGRYSILPRKQLQLRVLVMDGNKIMFLYNKTNGRNYQVLNMQPIDGSYLPPWDRALRVGVVAKGGSGSKAVFSNFSIANKIIE
ncbi:MAG TPA: family 43 glycosylhydrolase [Chitinophagaceae bacterium]|nr:family 43 glycosylhydrolase [Chitinophagaceae bacterium]